MANNVLLASDNFSSGSLAAGWTVIPGISGESSIVNVPPYVAQPGSASGAAYGQMWTALGTLVDQTTEVVISAIENAASSNVQLFARFQAGSLSGYDALISGGTAGMGTLVVYKATSGTFVQLGSTVTGLTVAAGDVWSFQAAGCALTVYQNGNRVFYFYDTTYTSGYPGFSVGSSTAVTNSRVSSWRGYNATQQDGIWQKQGIVITPILIDLDQVTGGSGLQIGTVLYDGNAQILSGNVYKTWLISDWTNDLASAIYYAESLDGINWTRRSSVVLSGVTNGIVTKVGSTYYLYGQASGASGSGNMLVYTSSDGINWAQQTPSQVLTSSNSGSWFSGGFYNISGVVVLNGTWYGYYIGAQAGGIFSTGLATSTDGINWVAQSISSPVIVGALRSGIPSFANGLWWMWCSANQPGQGAGTTGLDPFEIVRYSSPDLITWTKSAHSIHHSQLFESVNATSGGVFPGGILNVNGQAYMWLNSSQGDSANPAIGQISLAIAPSTIANIVTENEDGCPQIAIDNFTSGIGDLSGNWVTPTGYTKLQIAAGNLCEPSAVSAGCVMAFSGASFTANQYSECTLYAMAGTSFIAPCVRMATNAKTLYSFNLTGPFGSVFSGIQLYRVVNGATTLLGPMVSATPKIGDVWRLSVFTNPTTGDAVLSVFQNNFLILQVEDQSPIASGLPGIGLFDSAAVANAQISGWAAGNANVIPNYIIPSSLVVNANQIALSLVTIAGVDYLHLLNQQGNVIGYIDQNGYLGGTLGVTSSLQPTPFAQLTIQGAYGNDYLQFKGPQGNVVTLIDDTGVFNMNATPTQKAQKIIVTNDITDFFLALATPFSTAVGGYPIIGWIDSFGTLGGTL